MKLVKLVRPLFLAALCLHGLALFLPIGGAEEAVVEVEELGIEETLAEGVPLPPGRLPVPDLNVSSVDPTATPGGEILAIATPANSPNAIQQSPPSRQGAVPARPTPAPTRHLTPTNPPPNPTAQPPLPTDKTDNSSENNSALPSLPVLAPNDGTQAIAPTPTEPTPSSGGSILPVLTETDTEPLAGKVEAATTEAKLPGNNLIASAKGELPPALKALMTQWAIALTYSPKETLDSTATAAKSKWIDSISTQANSERLTPLTPERIAMFTNIRYPIESSQRQKEQSFRVCLEESPGNAEVGVLFDSQGEIGEEPVLIKGTGYAALNNEVIARIKNADDFPNNRNSKAFIFEVAVDYDAVACASLTDLKK